MDQTRLIIDRHFDSDWTWWGLRRFENGAPKYVGRLLRASYAVCFLSYALQHSELILAIVNVTTSGADEIRCDIPCDVQQRRATVPRFDDGARRVAGAG